MNGLATNFWVYCRFSALMILLSVSLIFAQDHKGPGGLDQLKFLEGEWIGDGSGVPGQGTGSFTFNYDLQNKIMIRKSFAEYPATDNKPAHRHDDLIVIYQTPGSDTLQAVYFDNEGHVINYIVDVAADQKSAFFTSPASDQGARYRLSYRTISENKVSVTFELAPPGQPEAFSTYIEATAQKKQ